MAQDGYLKLSDFGLSKIIKGRTYTICGTPNYIAPEIINNSGHGLEVDLWSLGILIYELIQGIDPFDAKSPIEIYEKIIEGKVIFKHSFDKDAKSLVKHLLKADIQ